MVVAGTVFMSECFVNDAAVFSLQSGLGIDVAVLGGVVIAINCIFTNQVLVSLFTGLAQSIYVGGEEEEEEEEEEERGGGGVRVQQW